MAYDISAFRYYQDDAAEGLATALGAENQQINVEPGDVIRVRQQLDHTLTSFADPLLGTREFDYDFDPSRLTTHTPDVERITANAGIAGRTLTGGPSNLEPRLVTENGASCASIVLGGDSSTPHFIDVGGAASGNYNSLHQADKAFALYFLIKRIRNSGFSYIMVTSPDGELRGIQLRISNSSGLLRIFVGDGTAVAFDMQAPSTVPLDAWCLVALLHDGADNWEVRSNNSVIATQSGTGGYGTGDPGGDPIFLNSGTALTNFLDGFTARKQWYTGIDHSANGLADQHYELVKLTYPGLGLP